MQLNLIQKFESIKEASIKTSLCSKSISLCTTGKMKTHPKGKYCWYFEKDYLKTKEKMEKEKNKGVLLFLDDIRDPLTQNWLTFSPITPDRVVWVKSYNEFVEWITQNGLPDAICFDHDLADEHYDYFEEEVEGGYKEKTGFDAAMWLINYIMDNGLELPLYNIHSANYVGKENIRALLENFKRLVK